jgi:hypothetical protein
MKATSSWHGRRVRAACARIDEVTIHEDDSVTSATCSRTHRPGEDAEE